MQDLYQSLLGVRHPLPPANEEPGQATDHVWDAADGEGPDRLFNRYRRLRLQALAPAENAA